jgi:cell division protease FtsH
MVTEYGMSARLGAVRYGRDQGDPFLGRSMGNQADYSLEVAHEIDEEVRALIEAAHTEAWEILNTYRDVLDDLVFELLEKETLNRRDLERIFDRVEKRPRITAFNDFGGRTPSDKPPIQTPAERARERGEPWPPHTEPSRQPAPVGSYPGGGGHPVPTPGPNGGPVPAPGPPGGYPGGNPGQPPFPAAAPAGYGQPSGPQQGWGPGQQPNPGAPVSGQPNSVQPNSVQPNYGAPADWRPATTPHGQPWPPAGQWQQPQWPQQPAPPAAGNGHGDAPAPPPEPPRENGKGPDEDGSR